VRLDASGHTAFSFLEPALLEAGSISAIFFQIAARSFQCYSSVHQGAIG
jgi:hypothetical protein